MKHRLLFAAAWLWLVVPTVGRAQDPGPVFDGPSVDADTEARALFANGQRMYAEGRYEQAIEAFLRAYELSDRPALLFNLANAYERLGRIEEALDALQKYRVYAPVEDQDVLLARTQALERRLAERPEVPAPAPSVVAPSPVMPAPLPAQPVRRSPAPWILAGIGAAASVAGTSVATATWATSRDALESGDQERWNNLRPVNNAGFATALAGGAMGVSGLVWGLAR